MPKQEPTRTRTEKLSATIEEQVQYIRDRFASQPVAAGQADIRVVPSDRGVSYMYAEGQILVRQEYLSDVEGILGKNGIQFDGQAEQVVLGVALQHLKFRNAAKAKKAAPQKAASPQGAATPPAKTVRWTNDGRDVRPSMVLDALEIVEDQLGDDIATPDQVLTVSNGSGGEIGPCPATEPEMVYDDIEPSPGVCWDNGGAGVRVYVADTGLLDGADAAHPWLHGVTGDVDALPPADLVTGVVGIPSYAGHGTFVAGVLRCLAPQADVHVAKVFKNELGGSALESDFVRRLREALHGSYDIFHVTVSSPSRNNHRLLAFGAWLQLMRSYHGTVCIAPAGNSGSSRLSWPAAFSGVVSVGALAADRRDRASFSNYGGWVDVYAPGRDLVNAYADGTYTCQVPPYAGDERVFYGMAKWSGTSFSTPVVTGLIAARMSRTGEGARQAAHALIGLGQSRAIAGVGAVLLPCDGTGGAGQDCPAQCCCTHRCPGCGC